MGEDSASLSRERPQGAVHSAIGFQSTFRATAPRLCSERCCAFASGGGHPLRRDRADGRRAEAMRWERAIQSVFQPLHRRWCGVSVAAEQIDHHVAGRSRDARSAQRTAVGDAMSEETQLLFPLWQIDREEYRAVCAHLGITPKAQIYDQLCGYLANAPFRFAPPTGFPLFLARLQLTRFRVARLDMFTRLFVP